jgi:WD40 repeat protein
MLAQRGTAVAFSPDGRTLAFGVWGVPIVRLWDIGTGQERKRLENNWLEKLKLFINGDQ